MFGESYFALRARLAEVIEGIGALADRTNVDLSDHLPPGAVEQELFTPFLFVACGEINSGKSSLLNALFGHDFCRTNVLPETLRTTHYRHGNPARDLPDASPFAEKYRPIAFLRDFEVIDTPGTNSDSRDHLDALLPTLPKADLLLIVFPISNPWGAATWDFVSQIPADALRRAVFVIQQCDQRSPADLPVILGHVRDLAMKRLGLIPPIHMVSAKLARESKQAAGEFPERWKTSGYPALEKWIADEVCDAPARHKALDEWRYRSAGALRLIEDRIEEQSRNFARQGRFLEQIEHEIVSMRERFVNRLPPHLNKVAEVFQATASGVARILGHRLGAAPSIARLFLGDHTGQRMETLFSKRLQETVEAVASTDGDEVVEACRAHWNDLRARVSEAMGVELGESDSLDRILAQSKDRFVQRLGNAASRGIGNLKVRHQLDLDLRRRNTALKSFTATTLLFLTAGSLAGACGLLLLPLILCGAAALFLSGGILTAWITRGAIRADFRDRLLDTCDSFASTLKSDYEEALLLVFQDYASSLEAVRKHLAAEKLALEPLQQRWQQLFLTLKAIEQDI